MYILGIEIKEDMIFSEYFSEELAIKYDRIKVEVVNYLSELVPEIINP